MADTDRIRRPEERVVQVAAPAAPPAEGAGEAGRPSIAVLPFANMSGDPEQEYFADGMVEEIITGLSRIRWLDVIARNSSFVYKGRAVDIRAVGRELSVRYVLEGSVRKGGDKLRITGQLIEAESGKHLWANKFDGALADVFELQDQVTAAVVGAIEPSVKKAEIERTKRRRPDNLDAYDLYLRALAHSHETTREGYAAAVPLIEQALALDPKFVQAQGLAAQVRWIRYQFWGAEPADREAALVHARAVRALHADDAESLAHAAQAMLVAADDRPTAFAMLEQALAYNPNCAAAHAVGAMMNGYVGNWQAAAAHAERALALSPLDPRRFSSLGVLANAKLALGDHEGAVAGALSTLQVNPNLVPAHLTLIAGLAGLERTEEARRAVQAFREAHPNFRIGTSPYLKSHQDLVPALTAAGVSE